MSLPAQRPLSSRARAAWRKAADELLIDAIFGSSFKTIRDGDPVVAPAHRVRCASFITPADLYAAPAV